MIVIRRLNVNFSDKMAECATLLAWCETKAYKVCIKLIEPVDAEGCVSRGSRPYSNMFPAFGNLILPAQGPTAALSANRCAAQLGHRRFG
jgi:hypothetical protein